MAVYSAVYTAQYTAVYTARTLPFRAFRSTVRHAEDLWKHTHSAVNWSSFKSLRNKYRNLILTAKKRYYSNVVSSSLGNPKQLWQTVNKLLHRKSPSPLPSSTPGIGDLLTTLLLSLLTKYLNFVCPLIATTPRHLHTHLRLLQLLSLIHI